MDRSIEIAFDNWLHDNAPSPDIYAAHEFSTGWTDKEIRDLMAGAFEAGYGAAIDMET